MKHLIPLILAMAVPANAQDVTPTDLSQYLWKNRPIIVFANSPEDPAIQLQENLFNADPESLDERDVVVIYDTDPDSELRKQFHPNGFSLMLIGKDGRVKLRKPHPWNVRELSSIIDKMPMRQQEMNRR